MKTIIACNPIQEDAALKILERTGHTWNTGHQPTSRKYLLDYFHQGWADGYRSLCLEIENKKICFAIIPQVNTSLMDNKYIKELLSCQ